MFIREKWTSPCTASRQSRNELNWNQNPKNKNKCVELNGNRIGQIARSTNLL